VTSFPNGIETRSDAVRFLGAIDGREKLELGEWDIDEFCSAPHPDAAIDRCRCRVRDELIGLLSTNNETDRERVSPLVSELIAELEDHAPNQ
jgi:hypothetical protein